jgi:20S proteasome alpha/beta subunit
MLPLAHVPNGHCFQELHNRLSRRRLLTIALGLVAHDGVVIAADRQSTEGGHKKPQRKIESLWALSVGALLVSGAGTASYIETMTQRLRFAFGTTQSRDSADGMTEEFRAVHSAFYSEAVLPFAPYEFQQRPDYELLFGCSTDKRHLLWYSEKLTLNQVDGFRAVGVGASAAEALLSKFYVTNLPLKVAIALAAYVVYEVKNSVEQCGFETDVLFTQSGMPPARVSPEPLKEMEEAFLRFRLVERDELFQFIGGGSVPRARNAKKWNKLRRDLRKTFESFYEGFDIRPPSPSE